MMGAGKSTVGPILAQRLGCEFVDLDAEVEREAGRSIVDIFESEGEAGFRRRERAAMETWSQRDAVVALGGGAIAQPGASAMLNESGVVVYLRGRVGTLVERLGDGSERPLLRGLSPADRAIRVEELLEARKAAYESARVVVDVDDAGAQRIAERVQASLEAVQA